jgi:hypothetical protein
MLISNSYDQAGRISQVFGNWNSNSTTYASIPTVFGTSYAYASHGAIQQMALGPILTEQTCYNNRLQAIDIRLGNGTTASCADTNNSDVLNLALGYGASSNNGNLLSQTITRGSHLESELLVIRQRESTDLRFRRK